MGRVTLLQFCIDPRKVLNFYTRFRMLVWWVATALPGILAIDPTPHLQVGSTWPDDVIPDEFCLPYDGSKVPDCSQYVDPEHYIPYYHEHSSNCSRFWECGPGFETCLSECFPCPSPPLGDGECQDQNGQWHWAAFF